MRCFRFSLFQGFSSLAISAMFLFIEKPQLKTIIFGEKRWTKNAAFHSIIFAQVGNTVVLVCARRTSAPGWTQLTVNLTLDPRLDKSAHLTHDPSLDKSVLNKDDAKISPTLVSSDSLKQNSCLSKVGLKIIGIFESFTYSTVNTVHSCLYISFTHKYTELSAVKDQIKLFKGLYRCELDNTMDTPVCSNLSHLTW